MRRTWKTHLLTIALAALDGAAVVMLWKAAHATRQSMDAWFWRPINAYDPFYASALAPYVALWWALLAGCGHYAHHNRISSLNELRRIVRSSFILFLAMPALAWFLKEFDLGRSVVLLCWAYLSIYLYASRTALRMAKRELVRRGIGLTRVIICGTGKTAAQVADSIRHHPEVGYHVAGFVDGGSEPAHSAIAPELLLGEKKDLAAIARAHEVDEVFLAEPALDKDELLNLVVRMEESRVVVKTVSNFLEVITAEFQEDELADFPVMNLRDGHPTPARAFAKRALDLAVALALAPVWASAWLAIAAYLRIAQGPPVHFVHERVGKDGRLFRLWKFRTMAEGTPAQAPAPDDPSDPRVTPAGRWLRRTSLDELPQMWNVLKGEMSLVGPRPEMPFIVEQYEEWQRRRLDVPPGLTGLWQVIGRKNLPLRYNLEYDFYYIRNQSFWLDVTILIRTIPAVIFGKGAF